MAAIFGWVHQPFRKVDTVEILVPHTYISNFMQIRQAVHVFAKLPIYLIYQNGRHFDLGKPNFPKSWYSWDISTTHLHFKFHANPSSGSYFIALTSKSQLIN